MANPNVPVSGQGGVTISSTRTEQAPFIYFDAVSCLGHNRGIIQVELAANVLMPDGDGVSVNLTQTAHLRCSLVTAIDLRESLDKAIAMAQQGPDQPPPIPTVN